MRSFNTHRGIAAALPLTNVDTDKILPGPFLKTISREGLGRHLFDTMRYDGDGKRRPDFVLNRPPWDKASILIALDNFGCGSSREHAPWALWDFGIRCIVAPSFADIFYNNCFKNGILPITLGRAEVETLMADAGRPGDAVMIVDLPGQSLTRSNGQVLGFELESARKAALLEGRDEISAALDHLSEIEIWEASRPDAMPAIHPI